jgi:AraC-like DNA-binding protein
LKAQAAEALIVPRRWVRTNPPLSKDAAMHDPTCPIEREEPQSVESRRYRERPPGLPSLSAAIDRVWVLRGAASGSMPLSHTVVPDGRIDLVFQLGELPVTGSPGRAYVVGPMRTPAAIRYEGAALVLGVRFFAGAAHALVKAPAHELVDDTLDLGHLWMDTSAIIDALASARDDRARVDLLEQALAARADPGVRADPLALAIERAGGRIDLHALAQAAGMSERQLQRRFRERVGLTPRMARRIARFSRATRLLRQAPDMPWPSLLHACGFYDQPHLLREFRAFAGTTPTRYMAARVGSIQDAGAGDPEIAVPSRTATEMRRTTA